MFTVASPLLPRLPAWTRPAAWLLAALVVSPLALHATEPAFQVRKAVTEADFGSSTSQHPMVLSGLSATGDMAGYFTNSSKSGGVTVYSLHSFVWQDATATAIDLYNHMSAESSIATCMSHSGTVGGVAWGLGTANQVGYVWRNGVMTTFQSPNGGDIDAVVGVNDSGYAIGTYFGLGAYKRAFLWDGTNSVDLGDFGDTSLSFVWPASINNGGEVVGTVYDFGQGITADGPPSSAFFWQNGVMSLVDSNGAYPGCAAVGINGLGQTACSYRPNLRDGGGGFVWEDGVLTDLGSLGGGGVVPFSITFNGTVIGTAYDGDDVLHVFRWQSGVMTDLGGVSLDAADTAFQLTGGNTAGNIVGFVTNDGGVTKAVWRSINAAGSGLLHDVATMLPSGTGFVADDTPGTSVLVNEAGRTACSGFLQGKPAVLLLLPDTDGDGMPDEWETAHDLNPLDPSDASADTDGDGLSNLQEYQLGTDPRDYFNGQTPLFTLVDGDAQTGRPGSFVSKALTVIVTNQAGAPLPNAPVAFVVNSGGGTVQSSNLNNPQTFITVYTDRNGKALVYYKLPTDTPPVEARIIAGTGGGDHQPPNITFTEHSSANSPIQADPFDPTQLEATLNPDGSVDVTWENHTDPADTEPINIRYRDRNGQWQIAITVPANTTSCHVPAQ